MNEKKYLKVMIGLCRNCGGRGAVAVEPVDEPASVDTVVEGVCPICGGSGRVKIRRDITVIIEPYNGFLKGV